jgi:uncharacterized membrane protein
MAAYGALAEIGTSVLTTAAMARVSSRAAGAAGGMVNVAHHIGGAVGLGILVTIFDAAGSHVDIAPVLLADRVAAALTGATVFLALALVVTLVARTRRSSGRLADEASRVDPAGPPLPPPIRCRRPPQRS